MLFRSQVDPVKLSTVTAALILPLILPVAGAAAEAGAAWLLGAQRCRSSAGERMS